MPAPSARRTLSGWRLAWLVAFLLTAVLAILLSAGSFSETSFHAAIRLTARSSLLLFTAAFTASSLHQLWRLPATTWLVANRRYIGVSFAISHAMHLVVILSVAALWPLRSIAARDPLTLIPGATVYAFILVMAATSSHRAVRWLGPRRWRLLHMIGAYAIWAAFAQAYLPRMLREVLYAPAALLVVAALGLRIYARVHARTGQGAAA